MTDQTEIKANDKLVCIDDAYQRVDLAATPDGLLVRGQVYCVSGISECGGVRLVGLRAISTRTGKEVGFDPARFRSLDDFRLKFPAGVSALSTGDDDAGYYSGVTLKPARPIELPEIEGAEEPKPLVLRVIEVLEMLHAEQHDPEISQPWVSSGFVADQSPEGVQAELRALLQSPKLAPAMNQSWTFWRFLMGRQNKTLLVCRNRSPVANMLFKMCMSGNILTEKFLEGDFQESDFPVLTAAAGRLSNAPIRICDARNPGSFIEVLSAAHRSFEYVLCDWTLTGEEMATAYRLTRDSGITILCPQ